MRRKTRGIGKSVVLGIALGAATMIGFSAPVPVYSQGAVEGGPEGLPAPVPPLPNSTAEDAINAAASGDPELMRRLVGEPVQLEGRTSGPLRETEAYNDFLVTTGPDFRLAGGELGVEVVVRVPAQLNMRDLPPSFLGEGNITDFEPAILDPRREGELINWWPVVTISTLR